MAPIHHHFELCGWSETRVVAVFFHYYSTSVPDRTDGHVMMPNLKSPKHEAEALREVERKYENTES